MPTATATPAPVREALRFLINPNSAEYAACVAILDRAIIDAPDHWEHVTGEPGRIDHYGYHDDVRSSVILSEEYRMTYYRLTIRPGLHPVMDALLAAVLAPHAA